METFKKLDEAKKKLETIRTIVDSLMTMTPNGGIVWKQLKRIKDLL